MAGYSPLQFERACAKGCRGLLGMVSIFVCPQWAERLPHGGNREGWAMVFDCLLKREFSNLPIDRMAYRCRRGKNRWDLTLTRINNDVMMAANIIVRQLLNESTGRPDLVVMAWAGARKSDRACGALTKQQLDAVRVEANIRPRAEPEQYYSGSWDAQYHQWQWGDPNWSQWSSSPSSSAWTRPPRWSSRNWNQYDYDVWKW